MKSEAGKPFSRKIMYAKVTSKSGTAPTAYNTASTSTKHLHLHMRLTMAILRTNKSPFLKSYTKSTLTNTYPHSDPCKTGRTLPYNTTPLQLQTHTHVITTGLVQFCDSLAASWLLGKHTSFYTNTNTDTNTNTNNVILDISIYCTISVTIIYINRHDSRINHRKRYKDICRGTSVTSMLPGQWKYL